MCELFLEDNSNNNIISFQVAELDSSKAITLDHTYGKAYARRAYARRELQNYSGALQDFEKSVTLDPNNKEAVRELQKTKQLLEQKIKEEQAKQVSSCNIQFHDLTILYSLRREW
jgi:tetratricopeptide (TPR) repeat protein